MIGRAIRYGNSDEEDFLVVTAAAGRTRIMAFQNFQITKAIPLDNE